MKELEVGQDYSDIIAVPEGTKMIFQGGNSWKVVFNEKDALKNGVAEKIIESPQATEGALKCINTPYTHTGI